jgi:hypothetical protein
MTVSPSRKGRIFRVAHGNPPDDEAFPTDERRGFRFTKLVVGTES